MLNLSIAGRRIRLDSISASYEQAIFREFDEQISRYMFPKPADSLEQSREFILSSLAACAAGNNLQFVILDKQSQEFLGCCGLHGQTDSIKPELGIWLKKSAHGQGLGKEAIHTLVFWAQEALVLESFIYPVDRRNEASRKIPLSLGGKLIAERREVGRAGNSLDLLVYQIDLPLAHIG